MNRREFFKTATAPIVIVACGFKLTTDQTMTTWHSDLFGMDSSVFQVGDICHVPRTAENMMLAAINNGKMVWNRHLEGSGADQEVRPDDAVWIIGSGYREGS